jgi:hypothetical protein
MALLAFKKAPDDSTASTRLIFWGYTPNSAATARIRFAPVIAEGYTISAGAVQEPISYTSDTYTEDSGGFKLVLTGPATLRIFNIVTSIGSGGEGSMEIIFGGATLASATAFFVENPIPYFYSGLPMTIKMNNLDGTSSQQLVVSDSA